MAQSSKPGVPYHDGERAVQRRAGTEDAHGPYSRWVQDTMSERVMRRVRSADLAVIATLDGAGHPSCWAVAGEPGMLGTLGPELLRIRAPTQLPLELAWQLTESPTIGVLTLDLEHRLRARINGQAVLGDGRITVGVQEAFTNCPKYVHARVGEPALPAEPAVVAAGSTLSDADLALIARSDTFFWASRSADGRLDATHRGGPAGFVDAGPSWLSFPDYAGNGMLQSLGNLVEDPRASLLFVDFDSGRWLRVTVHASVRMDGEAEPRGPITERVVACDVVAVTQGSGLARRWTSLEPSPHNPPLGRDRV